MDTMRPLVPTVAAKKMTNKWPFLTLHVLTTTLNALGMRSLKPEAIWWQGGAFESSSNSI